MDYRMLKMLTQLEREGGVWDDPEEIHHMLKDTEDAESQVSTPLEYRKKITKISSFFQPKPKTVDRTTQHSRKINFTPRKSNLTHI